MMLNDYRLLSHYVPPQEKNKDMNPRVIPSTKVGAYVFKNTVKLISINSTVVDKYFGVHNLSDYKLRKVRQSLDVIIPVDLEALCFKEVPTECISL